MYNKRNTEKLKYKENYNRKRIEPLRYIHFNFYYITRTTKEKDTSTMIMVFTIKKTKSKTGNIYVHITYGK